MKSAFSRNIDKKHNLLYNNTDKPNIPYFGNKKYLIKRILLMLNFICNPISGNSKASKAMATIRSELERLNVEYEFHITEEKRHATRLARQLTQEGYTDIVVIGGDGTLHEVLNGIVNPEKVTLGIIPCGSGNDFANVAKIPLEPLAALKLILSGNAKYTDYMVCSGIRGINIMGTGVDVEILKRCYKSKIIKGKLKYAISTVLSIISYKYPHVEAIINGQKRERDCFIVCTANGSVFGGGITIAPQAEIDDGKLDFVLVNGMKGSKKPYALIHLANGKILDIPETEFCNIENVKAIFNTPVDIQIDGEIYSGINYNVNVVHNELKVYRP